jgi:hypothetical protein
VEAAVPEATLLGVVTVINKDILCSREASQSRPQRAAQALIKLQGSDSASWDPRPTLCHQLVHRKRPNHLSKAFGLARPSRHFSIPGVWPKSFVEQRFPSCPSRLIVISTQRLFLTWVRTMPTALCLGPTWYPAAGRCGLSGD